MKQQRLFFREQESDESVPFTDEQFPPNASSIDGRRKTASSSSPSSFIPVCHCKKPARLKQVYKHGVNQGRYFHSCGSGQYPRRRKQDEVESAQQEQSLCNFFAWADNSSHDEHTLGIQWQRFKKSEGYKLVSSSSKFHASHVQQGGVGDCWFLSAVAVLAERNDLIENVVRSRELADDKGIEFNLFIDGRWTSIVVDNHLPLRNKKKGGSSSNSHVPSKVTYEELIFAYSRPKNDNLWVCFLEKAYAKAHGSYRAISGGWISEALLNLTGCPCEEIDFSSEDFDSEKTWYRIISFKEQMFPLGCSTSSSGEGIVGHHAYSILDCRELEAQFILGHQTNLDGFITSSSGKKSESTRSPAVNTDNLKEIIDLDADENGTISVLEQIFKQDTSSLPTSSSYNAGIKRLRQDEEQNRLLNDLLTDAGTLRVLRIRNPWGKTEFTGSFSANSELWTAKLMKTLDKGQKNDGTFWITYHDFLRRFSSIDVCKAHRGDQWTTQSVQDVTQPKELGCQSSFQMSIIDNTWLYISIIQKNKRGKFITDEDKKYYYSAMSFVIVKATEKESSCVESDAYDHGIDYGAMAEIEDAFFGDATPYSKPLELQLTPGNYRIVPMHLSNSKQQASVEPQPYFLHIYSSRPVIIDKIDCRTRINSTLPPLERLRAKTAHYAIACVLKQSLYDILSGGILLQKTFLNMKKKPIAISKSMLTVRLPSSKSSCGSSKDMKFVDLTGSDINGSAADIIDQIEMMTETPLSFPSPLPSMPMKHSLLILEGENVLFLLAVNAGNSNTARSAVSQDTSMYFSLILSTCSYSVNTPYISDSSTTSHPTARFVHRQHYKLVFSLQPNSFRCVATAVCCGSDAYKEFRIEDTAVLRTYSRSVRTDNNDDDDVENCNDGNNVDCPMSTLFATHLIH